MDVYILPDTGYQYPDLPDFAHLYTKVNQPNFASMALPFSHINRNTFQASRVIVFLVRRI